MYCTFVEQAGIGKHYQFRERRRAHGHRGRVMAVDRPHFWIIVTFAVFVSFLFGTVPASVRQLPSPFSLSLFLSLSLSLSSLPSSTMEHPMYVTLQGCTRVRWHISRDNQSSASESLPPDDHCVCVYGYVYTCQTLQQHGRHYIYCATQRCVWRAVQPA
ncbi:hypothetical protein L209DRAFT_237606 [Thermothelomyces heterothallicus CBS 203.75]